MKQISFNELKIRKFNTKNISNLKLNGICVKCNCSFVYSSVKKFLLNRKNKTKKLLLWETCQKCWFKINTSEDPEWIKNNKQAQLIAQNKPCQKKKNALGVSKAWTQERKKATSILLKERWKDPIFAKKALNNINWTQNKDKYFDQYIKTSIGSGGLKGTYKDIYYDSALELSYIFWCYDNNISILRYNLEPIKYQDINNKTRFYYPDFIINDNAIIEIKGLGLYYTKNYQNNKLKVKAAKKYFRDYFIIFSNDPILKQNYKKARTFHHENQKENI